MNAENPKRQTATQFAYSSMKSRIMSNSFKPSASYLENQLAEELGVSRTPVREAMLQLQKEGFVEVRPRHGMRVLPISARDMEEIYMLLVELEPLAAGLLAKRGISDGEAADLYAQTTLMEEALAQDDRIRWAETDDVFHQLLISLCGNKRLEAMVNQFVDQVHRARMSTLFLREKPMRSNDEHQQLLEFLKNQNQEGAKKLMRAHRYNAGKLQLAILRKHGLYNL